MEKDEQYFRNLQQQRDEELRDSFIFHNGTSIEVRMEIVRRLLIEDVSPEVIQRATNVSLSVILIHQIGIIEERMDVADEELRKDREIERELDSWERNNSEGIYANE